MVNCWEQKKKTPDNAGVFQLQAALQGMGGKYCLGNLRYRKRSVGFQALREGADSKTLAPRSLSGVAARHF